MNPQAAPNEPTTPPAANAATNPAAATPANPAEDELRERIIETLRQCYDPEIPVNIYDLGLIYDIEIDDGSHVEIKMTLTSPACPVAGSLPPDVEQRAASVEGVASARVDVVWDPPWDPDRMSEAAKLELGLM